MIAHPATTAEIARQRQAELQRAAARHRARREARRCRPSRRPPAAQL